MITIQNYKKINGMGLMEPDELTSYWLPTADWTGHPTIWIEGITEREDRYQIRVQTGPHYSETVSQQIPSQVFHMVIYRNHPLIETHWQGHTVWKDPQPEYTMESILTDTETAWERIKVEAELEILAPSNPSPF